MVRKSKDLYTVLGQRLRSGRPTKQAASKGRGKERERGTRSSRTGGEGVQVGGLGLVAVVMVSLVVGYLVGTSFADPVSVSELDASKARGQLLSPAELTGALSPEMEEKALSDHGYALIWFPALERTRAADLAEALRRKDFPNARIRKVTRDAKSRWFTVVYTDGPDPKLTDRLQAFDHRELRDVQSQENWPRFFGPKAN